MRKFRHVEAAINDAPRALDISFAVPDGENYDLIQVYCEFESVPVTAAVWRVQLERTVNGIATIETLLEQEPSTELGFSYSANDRFFCRAGDVVRALYANPDDLDLYCSLDFEQR